VPLPAAILSTEAFDRGDKFFRYRTWLPSLSDYILVTQAPPLLDHFQCQPPGHWELSSASGLGLDAQRITGGAAVDTFARFNVLAIVVAIDKSLATQGGPIVAVWGSTHRS
jgi:hypothetical protein